MTELEKVEKLREKADVTFAEAKEALDNSDGDILDALIYLENNGKVTVPSGGGFFSGADLPGGDERTSTSANEEKKSRDSGSGEEFADLMNRFGAFCLKLFNMGLNNFLEASRNDNHLFACPVIVIIVLLFFFPITIPLFIVSLFCGFRYRFTGEDLGKESVNAVMDSASDVVDGVKKSFVENTKKAETSEEYTNADIDDIDIDTDTNTNTEEE